MTDDSNDRKRDSFRDYWAVELDVEKCSLCEVCARRCPAGAIHLERTDEVLALYFRQGECTGCTAETSCEAICPEEAIKLIRLDAPAGRGEDVLLIESELVKCGHCGELFAPNKKLESLGKKGLGHEVERTLCPICRRKFLVVRLIDEKIVPGKHAEYRSTKDILRRSRFRMFQEDDES